MNFLRNLFNGTEKKAEITDNTADDRIVDNFNNNELAKAVLAAEEKNEGMPIEANLTSLIDEDRVKHVEGMSDTNLAQLYTEMSLYDEGKSVTNCFAEEFPKTLEDVKKNRKGIEKKILDLIPKHNLSKKANALNIWSVVNKEGKDQLVRMIGDPFAEISDASKTAFTLLSDLGVIKMGDEVESFGVDGEVDGTIGTVAAFHPCNFNNENLMIKFPGETRMVTTAQLKKNSNEVVIIREAPTADVLPDVNPEDFNEPVLPQVHTTKPGEIALVNPEAVSPVTDAQMSGIPQHLEPIETQVPAVYRNDINQPRTPNTKDFGEIHPHAEQEMAYFNQENAQKYNTRKITDNKGMVTSTSPTGCMVQLNAEDPNSTIYVHTNDMINQEKIASLSGLFKRAENIQYVDKTTKAVVTPETAAVVPGEMAPEKITTKDGKELEKQVVDKPIQP